MPIDAKQINSVSLAYLGDAVYELFVRNYLISSGNIKPGQLHEHAIQFVTAKAQSRIAHHWLNNGVLSEEEERVVKRGRNAKSGTPPKHTSIQAYRYSTGLEALFGYLHRTDEYERIDQLMEKAIEFIESGM